MSVEAGAVTGEIGRLRADSLAKLFGEHYAPLVRLARAITADPELAQELAQEAFVRSWGALSKMRDPEAAPFYLRKTLVNLARRSIRRRLREKSAPPSISGDRDPAERINVVLALRSLPPRQRACVALRYLEDLSEQDTARALGVSVGTVKSQTHKALRRLEDILGDSR